MASGTAMAHFQTLKTPPALPPAAAMLGGAALAQRVKACLQCLTDAKRTAVSLNRTAKALYAAYEAEP